MPNSRSASSGSCAMAWGICCIRKALQDRPRIKASRPAHSAAQQREEGKTMPNVILRVTLNETIGALDVDQSGNGNEIGHGKNEIIEWKLTGNMEQGTFNSMSA